MLNYEPSQTISLERQIPQTGSLEGWMMSETGQHLIHIRIPCGTRRTATEKEGTHVCEIADVLEILLVDDPRIECHIATWRGKTVQPGMVVRSRDCDRPISFHFMMELAIKDAQACRLYHSQASGSSTDGPTK